MMRRYAFGPHLTQQRVDRLLGFLARSRFLRRAILALPDSRLRRELLLRIVALFYRAFNERGQLPRALLDPEMKAEQTAAIIDTAGTFHGIEGWEAMVGELRDAFGQIRFEPESMVELSPKELLLMVRFRASGGGSGVTASRMVAHRVTLDTGSIKRFEVSWEPEEALNAAGLTE